MDTRLPPGCDAVRQRPGRRRLLQALSALPMRQRLLAAGVLGLPLPSPGLAATPSCGAGSDVTPRQTEGPYFTPDSPRRLSLVEPDMNGARLVLIGRVLAPDCRPQPGALLDFWQADAEGAYDNRGFRLRGHQFTDADGRYRLETVMPGLYPGRTRHIHVKVQPQGGPVLTTQLYFPNVPQNRRDGLFSPALLVSLAEATAAAGEGAPGGASGKAAGPAAGAAQAGFDFVVRTG
jgi:protocatechuate 3,4-dioxygenase beta subunit